MGLDISVKRPIMPTPENLARVESYDVAEYSIGDPDGEFGRYMSFSYKKINTYNNLEATFQKFNANFEDYDWLSMGEPVKERDHSVDSSEWTEEDYDYWWKFKNKHTGEELNFKQSDVITFEQEDNMFLVEEVGYQRKGANQQFYEDGMWGNSPIVTDRKVLLEHWDKYFSHQTPDSKGGWGSGTDSPRPDGEMRENFRKNIIDHFVDNETFVIYH